MSDLSNIYVEKINSEHPLAVWMLNEEVDYVSIISEEQRQFYNSTHWTLTNATAIADPNSPEGIQFASSALSRFNAVTIPTSSASVMEARSTFFPNGFNTSLANFSISFYLYPRTQYISSVVYGYEYYDTSIENKVEVVVSETITAADQNRWRFFAKTFALPPTTPNVTNLKFLIRFNIIPGGATGTDYGISINGLTLGQWSEEFHKTSLGLNPLPFPSNIAIDTQMNVIPAFQYGSSGVSGYYTSCAIDKRLYSINFGVPLVYGSENTTKLYAHIHGEQVLPNLLFPGYGFMNSSGKFNEYTAEMWLRINTDSVQPKKIFGPITGNDGLYVEGPFMTFVIGKNYGSYFVGEWFRPMLIHIRIIRNNATVLVNGEEVISIDYLDSDLVLPDKFNSNRGSALYGKDQDWLGFYAQSDVSPIAIDSFAIYSYPIPTEVAKRRWVWGQGVVPPEIGANSTNSNTAFNDYSFANYAANYNYPDLANWRQGFFSNVETTNNTISMPSYSLPTFNIGSFTEREWLDSLQSVESAEASKYITFRPNSSWNDIDTYIYFEEFNALSEKVESFYGVFDSSGSAVNEPVFKIINKITGDSIIAVLNGTTLTYSSSIAGVSTTIATKTITPGSKFVAGINLSSIAASSTIPGINRFFTDQSLLEMYVAGDGQTSFTGKIYRVGFNGAYNNRKITSQYNSGGIFNNDTSAINTLMSHVANYTLKAFDQYGVFFLDIAVAGYWEDYVPLSYFGKFIKDSDGESNYELDSIQLNLDYPEPVATSSTETVSNWTYADLKIRYQVLNQTYEILSNNFYSGWDDYEDMKQDSEKYYYYETGSSAVRSFISFQRLQDGITKNLVDFQNFAVPQVRGVVDPAVAPTDWEDTAFEVVDGTIIYPPTTTKNDKTINFTQLSLVYHLEFQSEGIFHHPISFRDLQLASQVLNRTSFTEIGTKFGTPAIPYHKTGDIYNLKSKNPIATYKESTPYLFMNKHSGWKIKGEFTTPAANSFALVDAASSFSTPAGNIVVYSADNEFLVGQTVTITGLTTTSGQSLNLSNKRIAARDGNSFTVFDNAVGTASGPAFAEVKIDSDLVVDRGISIPVNRELALDINVSAIQVWLNYSERIFPTQRIPIMSVEFNGDTYTFYLKQDESQQRGYIFVKDSLDRDVSGIQYYVNGKSVDVPYLVNQEWAVFGVAFSNLINFDGFTGRINLNGPLTYNNVAYYLASNLQQEQRITSRSWGKIKSDAETGKTVNGSLKTGWAYWYYDTSLTTFLSWSDVKILNTDTSFAIDPSSIYNAYVGTNRFIIDDNTDGIKLDPERLRVYSGVDWAISSRTPV